MMNNVIRLFDRKNAASVDSKPERSATAAANVLSSSAKLDLAIRSVSKLFDAVEIAIDSIDDPKARSGLRHSAKLNRVTLSNAVLRFSQHLATLQASVELARRH
jgi:hypothetical protein